LHQPFLQTPDVRAQVIGQFLARAESVFLQTNQGVEICFFIANIYGNTLKNLLGSQKIIPELFKDFVGLHHLPMQISTAENKRTISLIKPFLLKTGLWRIVFLSINFFR
jgi:hypothetical protein